MEARIIKLSDSTIRKIAAGEVITRPLNVVKELLENSIDAGATNIIVTIEQGGLKLIEINDNGHGIAKSNAKLLCHRYATSKLTKSDDLARISTFGFRGEALASISEMADIETRSFNMRTDKMGWQAHFKYGVPSGQIQDKYLPMPGTQIRVKELFSTTKPRKNALTGSFSDEKKNIVDLVTRFAIHHRNTITFTLRESLSGSLNELVCSLAPTEIKPSIGSFFGVEMERNLLDFEITQQEPINAMIYGAFSHKKSPSNINKSILILFVNDRLVECDELRREIGALVLEFLGAKQVISLFYISIDVPAQDVDVNTHPSKETVTLHYQQDIIALILTEVRIKFQESLASRDVSTKESSQKTIGELIKYSATKSQGPETSKTDLTQVNEERLRLLAPSSLSLQTTATPVKRPYELIHTDPMQLNLFSQLKMPPHEPRRDLKLASIHELRERVASEQSKDNIIAIKESVFVGLFDHSRALIQNGSKLYAINFKAYLKEQLYQFYLFDFGNFPPIEIVPPGNKLPFMIEMNLNDIEKHEPEIFESLKFRTSKSIIDALEENSSMFQDYLTLKFEMNNRGVHEIKSIPCIIPDHIPNLVYLGRFFIDLANKVDYSNELDCLHQIGRVIADFYSEPPANMKDIAVHRKYHEFVNTRLFDAIKRYLIMPDWLFTKENICQITDTHDLYKVFERC